VSATGDYFRKIGDDYARYADVGQKRYSGVPGIRAANLAEAAKYYERADRFDRVLDEEEK
jgi:hypothetical protein